MMLPKALLPWSDIPMLAGEGRVRRTYWAEGTFDRARILRDSESQKDAVMAVTDHLFSMIRDAHLTPAPTFDVAVSDQRSDLIMRNKVAFVVTVEAEGLLPEERLPQGWRAFFCAP